MASDAPPTRAEQILFQAMADYERETDPKELYDILDIQRKRASLIHEDLLPALTTDNRNVGPFVPGSEDQEAFFRSYFD